jgi:histidine ammonia-lyase
MKIKEELSLEDINKLILQEEELELTPEIKKQIIQCYEFLENFSKEKVIYGINTGFGPMAQWKIEDKDLEQLQYNIIRSHSTGAGNPLPNIYVRAALLSRIMTFIKGHSGVNINSVELLMRISSWLSDSKIKN